MCIFRKYSNTWSPGQMAGIFADGNLYAFSRKICLFFIPISQFVPKVLLINKPLLVTMPTLFVNAYMHH